RCVRRLESTGRRKFTTRLLTEPIRMWLRWAQTATFLPMNCPASMGKLWRFLAAIAFAWSLWAADPPGMVLIPAGEFLRGRSFKWTDYDVKWYPNPAKDDQPARKISVDPFFM